MPDENALVPFEALPLSLVPDDVFDESTTTGTYLPRLQFISFKSELVAENAALSNNYCLIKDKVVTPLGQKIHVTPVSYRLKAIDVNDKNRVIVTTNFKGDLYREIEARSETPNSGCMVGPEFLVFVHGVNQFALLHMNNASAKREAPKLKAKMRQPTLLHSKVAQNSKGKWQAITVNEPEAVISIPADCLANAQEIVTDFLKVIDGPELAEAPTREV